MDRPNRDPRSLLLAVTVVALVAACGGNDDSTTDAADDSSAEDASTTPAGTTTADPGSSPDPVAVEACLEDAGLMVRNQDEVDRPYTDEELDFFELETEILIEGGDTEFISGSISFYRTIERAEEQEVNFEESVTEYTVGRNGTAVYALVGGTVGDELDAFVDTIDGCLAEG